MHDQSTVPPGTVFYVPLLLVYRAPRDQSAGTEKAAERPAAMTDKGGMEGDDCPHWRWYGRDVVVKEL